MPPRRGAPCSLQLLLLLAAALAAPAAAADAPPPEPAGGLDALTPALAAALRDNPDFAAALLERGAAGPPSAAAPGAAEPNAGLNLPIDILSGGEIDALQICPALKSLNAKSNVQACSVVGTAEITLLASFSNACPNTTQTGYGSQSQPPAHAAGGGDAPRPLLARAPAPEAFGAAELLAAEGATYAFLWGAIRNIYAWWTCSSDEGGSLDGYLLPTGFEGVGGDTTSPGAYKIDKKPYMVILKRPSTSQLVFLFRGTGTKEDWLQNFAYLRTRRPQFSLNPLDRFPGSRFPGEVHFGFLSAFRAAWPKIRAALDAESLGGARLGQISFAGHSQGAAVAAMAAFASTKYLESKGAPRAVDAVLFGAPNLGNSDFVRGLATGSVNVRNVAFRNDVITQLPCQSAKADRAASMPACLYPGPVPTRTSLKTYWADYQPSRGVVAIAPSDMPVQTGAWARTNLLNISNIFPEIRAGHYCSYTCFLSTFVTDQPDDSCLVEDPPVSGYTKCRFP
ncbi:hypothetical protein Rsub_03435 [Raphidocelis subcapitata]|uniref:Fungal lipase-type domain-containing protein n=1 Tax=Raphidocelis subcapitata TaxID=307507 RepID=A0A2V0NSZ5_9CHLO|nr:hypothetical protein Rsub_03435 [Raphidocelis subcapitata]|eukprot:GBF90439.1 hypothetical protein Rsub_03435 [Raphidocelis subcapitata]